MAVVQWQRWSLDQAAGALARIAEGARMRGWLVAIYGSSVTRSDGRDLDLICVPWRSGAEREDMAAILLAHFGANEVDRNESAWDQSLGVAYRTADGKVIDVLYVRRVDEQDVV